MLDAAHGEGRCPAAMVERVHVVRVQVQIARAELACGIGRRGPAEAPLADVCEGTRRLEAVARSRR